MNKIVDGKMVRTKGERCGNSRAGKKWFGGKLPCPDFKWIITFIAGYLLP